MQKWCRKSDDISIHIKISFKVFVCFLIFFIFEYKCKSYQFVEIELYIRRCFKQFALHHLAANVHVGMYQSFVTGHLYFANMEMDSVCDFHRIYWLQFLTITWQSLLKIIFYFYGCYSNVSLLVLTQNSCTKQTL